MTDIDDYTHSILNLVGVSNLLEEQPNLENGLREVASLTAQRLKTQRCSIMLLSELEKADKKVPCLRVFAHYGNLPASAYREVTELNQGIAGHVAATATPLLIEDITKSEFAAAARDQKGENKSLICAPIFWGEQVLGTINVSNPLEKRSFTREDLDLLEVFALFVGKSIYIAQLQTIMRSKFVQMAVVSDLTERAVQDSPTFAANPTQLAKIVAKSFFRELTQAGFGTNQIIEIATEVLNLLQNNLTKYKKRIIRDSEQ